MAIRNPHFQGQNHSCIDSSIYENLHSDLSDAEANLSSISLVFAEDSAAVQTSTPATDCSLTPANQVITSLSDQFNTFLSMEKVQLKCSSEIVNTHLAMQLVRMVSPNRLFKKSNNTSKDGIETIENSQMYLAKQWRKL
jgi:hypothetical protein